LERWIVSSRFGAPKNAMSKCRGASRDVGILYDYRECVASATTGFQ
jgi:hypothetical protein